MLRARLTKAQKCPHVPVQSTTRQGYWFGKGEGNCESSSGSGWQRGQRLNGMKREQHHLAEEKVRKRQEIRHLDGQHRC